MSKFAYSRRAMHLVFGGLLSFGLISCGSSSSEQSETSVYGGSKTPAGAWSNVVAITGGGGIFCSGTAVTPNLVITAAHCAEVYPSSQVSVYVGAGVEGGSVSGQYAATKFKASPKYGSSNGANDIAYIVLKTPINLPASAFTPVLTDAAEVKELLAIGKTAHIVGFGNRDNGGFGVKFEVDANVTKVNSLEITIGGGGKDSCNGDSGGPVFGKLLNGQWRVYGVTSRGGSCGTGGIYGLMHANICWIQADSGLDLNLPAGTCP